MMMRKEKYDRIRPGGGDIRSTNIDKIIVYIFCNIVYSKREQSKRQRVKCHRDGEFARRTKVFTTMLSPHPLPI